MSTLAAAAALPEAAAARVSTAAEDDEVVILDSDSEDATVQRASSSRGAGPSRPAAPEAVEGRQHRQRSRPAAAAPAAAAGGSGGGGGGGPDIIDLTSDSPLNGAGEVQILQSTVVPRQPTRGAKRPRTVPSNAGAGAAGLPAALAGLSPAKQLLLARLYNAPPPPPPEPEPEGPKCGICMEAMGGSNGRQMASGPCGHVYCHECLVEAVRAQKKCPTCRKNMQARQIHKVFVNFT